MLSLPLKINLPYDNRAAVWTMILIEAYLKYPVTISTLHSYLFSDGSYTVHVNTTNVLEQSFIHSLDETVLHIKEERKLLSQ